jgi:hypothetical protein
MWGNSKWKSYKDSLIRASLLVAKPSGGVMTLLPFMNARAYEMLEEDGKEKYHLK